VSTIYSVQVSNTHQSIIAEDDQDWFDIASKINEVEFGKAFHRYRFQFYADGKKPLLEPNVGCIYISGAFAFAKSLKSALFPGSSQRYEFSEIQVGRSDWLLLNCLLKSLLRNELCKLVCMGFSLRRSGSLRPCKSQ
jgi:hypothetical protein